MILRQDTFAGGIELADDKYATIDAAIEPLAIPAGLLVPLAPLGHSPAAPLVAVGQTVKAGDLIARAEQPAGGVNVFAPLAGRVNSFTTTWIASGDAFVSSPAVELVDLHAPASQAALPESDWLSAKPGTLLESIRQGGLTTFRSGGWAMADWIERAMDKKVNVLIANGMESQPYVTADHRLLTERGPDVMRGLAIIAMAMEVKETILAVDHRHTGDYRSLLKASSVYQVQRVALPHKYPTGLDPILASIITGREIPIGGKSFDIGVAVVNPAACVAVYDWVAAGRPPTGRVVTLSGERMSKPGNFWIPFGTRLKDLTSQAEDCQLIHGGPMTGVSYMDQAVVGPGTDAVLAIEPVASAPPSPCIRCGWCTDHCPARLNVAALNDMYELGQARRADRAGVLACIECGVCTYVCPARLPLTKRVKQLKGLSRQMRAASPQRKARKRKQ